MRKLKYLKEIVDPENLKILNIEDNDDRNDDNNIIEQLKKLTPDDIIYEQSRDSYYVKFPPKIQNYYDEKEYNNIYFSVESENYNRLHFPNSLPREWKNIRLGYKIYKGFIKKLGYASSRSNASAEAQRMWSSITEDPDIYTLVVENSVIAFYKTMGKEEIKEILINYLASEQPNININTIVVDPDLIKLLPELKLKKWLNKELFNRYNRLLANKLKDKYKDLKDFVLMDKVIYIENSNEYYIYEIITEDLTTINYKLRPIDGIKWSENEITIKNKDLDKIAIVEPSLFRKIELNIKMNQVYYINNDKMFWNITGMRVDAYDPFNDKQIYYYISNNEKYREDDLIKRGTLIKSELVPLHNVYNDDYIITLDINQRYFIFAKVNTVLLGKIIIDEYPSKNEFLVKHKYIIKLLENEFVEKKLKEKNLLD